MKELLDAAGVSYASTELKRVASARSLYHWNADAKPGILMTPEATHALGAEKASTVFALSAEESSTFDRHTIAYIQHAAPGVYEIWGLGPKRKLPHFDDLVFLGASLSRYPLEGIARSAAPGPC